MGDPTKAFLFASYRLVPDRRALLADGHEVSIRSRAFDLLLTLVERRDRVVSKDELLQLVWPGRVVEEGNLSVHIAGLRKLLGGGMIATLPGRGYRFVAPVEEGAAVPMPAAPAERAERADIAPAPGRVEAPPRTNLPASASRLIGRDAAVAEVLSLLDAHRLVTLTGAGGIGKTRLGLEVGRRLLPHYADGVWLVELGPLSDGGLVPSAVASALGLDVTEDTTSADAVAQALRSKELLLILDNCEHLIEAAASMAEVVVRLCPRASVLATSRELLRIDGEHAYRVAPLDVPPRHEQEPDTVLEHSAVQLFIDRAKALQSYFTSHRENLPAIAAICQRLDGIPLAIELAAARVATLGLEAILSRLEDRFALLTGGRRTALPRQQTLRATLDWSYELLPEAERCLLRSLAVFAGGFTLEAATAVMSDTGSDASMVVDGIANLVAKSLVAAEVDGADARYRLLETTRAYALEKLAEAGEAGQAARRHAEFFRDFLASQAFASELRPGTERMARCCREIDNVRAAIDWALTREGDTATGIAIVAGYVPVWLRLSLLAECHERAERALDSLDSETGLDAHTRMQLQIALGAALQHGTHVSERVGMAKALETAETMDDVNSQLRALWAMWTYRFNGGEHQAARPFAERFLRVARRAGDPADVLVGDRLMGNVLHFAGCQQQARDALERVVDRYVAPDDQRHTIWFHYDQRLLARAMLARVLWLQGFLDQAELHAQASLADAQAMEHKASVCYVLGNSLYFTALMAGDLAAAQRSVATLSDMVARNSVGFWRGWGRCVEGVLRIKRGEFETGSALLRSALDTLDRAKFIVMHNPEFLCALAEGLAGAGQLDAALATIDEALARSDHDGACWCVGELLRVKGELLLRGAGRQSVAAAEGCFLRALDVAQQQGALFWELRAALSLSRLRVRQDRHDDARQIVAPVYKQFTEGFGTVDLQAARTLLEELPPQRTAAGC